MSEFLLVFIDILFLFIVASFVNILARKIGIPYTVLLFVTGMLLYPLSEFAFFGFIESLTLTPELLFYVFLPVLLFESGYNIKYKELTQNKLSIWTLAIVGMLISTLLVASIGYYALQLVSYPVPFAVMFLFGALISATDPVAVLSLFKEVGAPRRLSLIFEGESLFNDGTALALFFITLEIIISGVFTSQSALLWALSFAIMIIGGILLGLAIGIGFSHIIKNIKNNEAVEITLTMVLAHVAFITAELISHFAFIQNFDVQISGVIATAISAIIMGNYGRTKISPKVEEYMERFWSFFAFLGNSLVFLLMGILLFQIPINWQELFLPVAIMIVVVMIARAISIYLPINTLNALKLEDHIPVKWQHLLAWGSLRGSLVLMMVLLIPEDLSMTAWQHEVSIKNFLLALTLGAIAFTLFVKAPTITTLVKKLGLHKLHSLERFEKAESEILIYLRLLKKIDKIYKKGYICANEYKELKKRYEEKLKTAVDTVHTMLSEDPRTAEDIIYKAVSLHALGIEKQYLKELFSYNEINEYVYRFLLHKIDKQTARVENGQNQVKELLENPHDGSLLDKINNLFAPHTESHIDTYLKSRTKEIISRKVVKELRVVRDINLGFDAKYFDHIIELYMHFNKLAKNKVKTVQKEHESQINRINTTLATKSLMRMEEKIVEDFYDKEMITPKIYNTFCEEIEEELASDFHKNIK